MGSRTASPPRPTELASGLYSALRDVRRVLRRRVRHDFPLAPLALSQVELLRLVDGRPGLGVKEAAEALRLAPNTVSTLVSTLVDENLLVRDRDPQDARVVRLRVTGHARRRMAAWQNQGARVLHDALASLDGADRARVAAALPVLRRLAEIMEGDR